MNRTELVSAFPVFEIRGVKEHEMKNNWIDVQGVFHIHIEYEVINLETIGAATWR